MTSEKVEFAKKLSIRLKTYFDLISKHEKTLASFEMDFAMDRRNPDEWAAEYEEVLAPFKDYLETVTRDLMSLAELFGLKEIKTEIQKKFNKHQSNPALFDFTFYHNDMYSPYFRECKSILESMTSMISFKPASGLEAFESILENTNLILSDQSITPKKEVQVSNPVYRIMQYAFHDATRPTIPQFIKTYKPDIGVISLKAAAEYKFISSENELKTAMGGIYEDIHGYAGSNDWKIFYSVFYITKPIIAPKRIIKEFKKVKVPTNWHSIIIQGTGSR